MSLIVEIASVPDRDEVVAEIWYGQNMVAEISLTENVYKVELYPNPVGDFWSFDLVELIQAFELAKLRLVSG